MIMDRKIFNLNLSVEATSAYILICSLAEGGAPVTIDTLNTFWNGTVESLQEALSELQGRRIISETLDAKMMRIFLPNPASTWIAPDTPAH